MISRSRDLLGLPDDYLLGIVPASDTGAMEMAMWNLLGPRGVDVLAWESFGAGWVSDVRELGLDDVRVLDAEYGHLPDLSKVDSQRDVIFTWNGTTSGVCVPDADWVSDEREGLVLCDATSAAFAMPLAFEKLDVITWSWQKAMGGEGAHGMLALSPRAVARLESHVPTWPLPKIFKLTKKGKLETGIFSGSTINTPSLLAVEDHLDALRWAETIGGLPALVGRSKANLASIARWVGESDWVAFLAVQPETISSTSVCLQVVDEWFVNMTGEGQAAIIKDITARLEAAGVAFDVASYRDAPPGLRIWAGSTVEQLDIERLLPWITWAYHEIKADRCN